MNIDFIGIFDDLKEMFHDMFKEHFPELKQLAFDYVEGSKERLVTLAKARASKQIDDTFFLARLGEEKEILISELLSFKVIGEVIADEATKRSILILIASIIGSLI